MQAGITHSELFLFFALARSIFAGGRRLGVLLSCHPKSRTVRKYPTNQPTFLAPPVSAKLHPPKSA